MNLRKTILDDASGIAVVHVGGGFLGVRPTIAKNIFRKAKKRGYRIFHRPSCSGMLYHTAKQQTR